MSTTVTVPLNPPASDMAREEILKQVVHLSPALRSARMPPDGSSLSFEVPAHQAERTRTEAEKLCALIHRSLRRLQRKVVHRSTAMEQPIFRGAVASNTGVHAAGKGQVILEGLALQLFDYFDAALARLESHWTGARQLLTPTLIPANVLARCDYFRSFPNTLTFACHLEPDAQVINAFRDRHNGMDTLDAEALADMAQPETCLSPAVCYHVYHRNQGHTIPPEEVTYRVRGKCFRYEGSNLRGLTRLWDFTMRELVCLGTGDYVMQQRQRYVELIAAFLDELQLAAEIRTASDPFYIAPDAPLAHTYFQLTAETKYEVSALLPEDERLAVGSLNYHTDFFGRAFDITLDGGGYAHSACIGFGLERLVWAFLAQHGGEPDDWPENLRRAIFASPAEAASPFFA